MTRLPAESWDITAKRGDLFPKYKVGPVCCVPGCSRYVDHAHHIARRSFVIGDVWWVQYGDGPIIGNVCGMCWRCHEEVTRGTHMIVWDARHKVYYWCVVNSDNNPKVVAGLFPQPPMMGQLKSVEEHVHIEGPGSSPNCQTCGRPVPRKKEPGEKTEEKKRRKTWTVTVPDSAEEDGAVVLDSLLEICREMFGRDDGGNVRYYVLAQALALVVQNGHLLSDSK